MIMISVDDDFFEDLLALLVDIYTTYGRKSLVKLLREHNDVRNNLFAYFVSKEVINEKHL